MLFYLALKNILSRKSSIIIVLFIALSLTLMTVINSLFESTERGVETVYTQSFTGDIVIRPKSLVPMSLFGDETPITGELTKTPGLTPYQHILDTLEEIPGIAGFVPQVTVQAAMEIHGQKAPTYVFGVPGESYAALFPSLRILEGEPYGDNSRGVMLPKNIAEKYGASVGEAVQFMVQDGLNFIIRAATLTAIYDYVVENDTLDRMTLADPYTARMLSKLTAKEEGMDFIDESRTDLLDDDLSFEDLFFDAEDTDAFFSDTVSTDADTYFTDSGSQEQELTEKDFSKSTAWNYILVRLEDPSTASLALGMLNHTFKKNGWPVEAVNWRNAAGSTALYLYWLRIIFNAGVLVILAAGFIIINNTLVVGVLNRTQEIGTLRAEGASRLFISVQCMVETFLLTLTAGIAACILGSIVSAVISGMHIALTNSFIAQLFGATTLTFATSLHTMAETMLLSVLLGLLGWVYPVHTALSVTPVQAMGGGT